MSPGQIIDTVIAFATSIAAFSAASGAFAAWKQVKLQRPRPVVIVEGRWSLDYAIGGPNGFRLQNVGSSSAFDIQISEIEGPVLKPVQYKERLTTDHIFVLPERTEPLEVTHHRHASVNVINHQAAATFIQNAGPAFSAEDDDGNPNLTHDLNFFVEYSALDGRRFKTKCLMRFNLGIETLNATIMPSYSWLGVEIKKRKFWQLCH